MVYATAEQLLGHIQHGKSLAWLAGASGMSADELEALADRNGYVFGSNGVPRRSAIPLGPDTESPTEVAQQNARRLAASSHGRELAAAIHAPAEASPPEPVDGVLALIGTAQLSGRQSTRTLAERLLRLISDVGEAVRAETAQADARAEVERLELALAEARERAKFRGNPPPKADADSRTVREWAAVNGLTVSSTGKVPQRIVDAYLAAKS
jgi:hypothetical protein